MTLDRKPTPEGLEKIAAGCEMDGGAPGGTGRVFVQPVAVIRDDTDASKQTRVRVVVAEGRNREVGGWVGGGGLAWRRLANLAMPVLYVATCKPAIS